MENRQPGRIRNTQRLAFNEEAVSYRVVRTGVSIAAKDVTDAVLRTIRFFLGNVLGDVGNNSVQCIMIAQHAFDAVEVMSLQ